MSTEELRAALVYASATLEYISKHPHQAELIARKAALAIDALLAASKVQTQEKSI